MIDHGDGVTQTENTFHVHYTLDGQQHYAGSVGNLVTARIIAGSAKSDHLERNLAAIDAAARAKADADREAAIAAAK